MKVAIKREKNQACLSSSEREQARCETSKCKKVKGKQRNPSRLAGNFFVLEVQALLDGFDLGLGSLDAALVIGGILEAGILHLGVELDLRLGT